MIDPIKNDEAQFVCRRGGKTDRNRFVNFDALIARFCGQIRLRLISRVINKLVKEKIEALCPKIQNRTFV